MQAGRLIRDNQGDKAGTQPVSLEKVAAEMRAAANGDKDVLAMIELALANIAAKRKETDEPL